MSNLISWGQPCFEQGPEQDAPLPAFVVTAREAPVGCGSCGPVSALSKLTRCSVRGCRTHSTAESLPSSGPPGKQIYLLQKQGIGRTALQDASDVVLK